MRKTFEELAYENCRVTWMVGDLNLEQDDNTPDDECYWLNVGQVKELLELVRIKTLEECIVAAQSTKFEPDTAILELSKDSIELEPYKSDMDEQNI